MTAPVPRQGPFPALASRFYIGNSLTPAVLNGMLEKVAHLLGHQLPTIHECGFGPNETATSGTYRVKHHASENVRAIAILAVPAGVRTSIASGTMDVPGSESPTPITWRQNVTDTPNLGQIDYPTLVFVKPVTANTLQEHTYTVTDLRLHSVTAFEVPRLSLSGTQAHLDRSFASPDQYLSDDLAASDPRGWGALLNAILDARINMRRHPVSMAWQPGTTTAGASGYLIGSATAGDGLTVYTRKVMGSGVNTTPCRFQVYVEAMTAANTFHFDVTLNGGTVSTGAIAAASVPGWFDADPGFAIEVSNDPAGDVMKVEWKRDAGAGTCRVAGISLREAVT